MTAQSQPENVRLGEDGESVVLLDQTRLPGRVEYRTVRDLKEMVEAIRTLRVRGAPAIGVFAGFCLSALARQMERAGLDTPGLLRELDRKGKILVSSRPTAVNLSWAVERMMDRASGLAGGAPEELAAADKRATAMLLNAKNRAARFLQKLYDRAGTKPEYQAMALSDFYSEDGIHLPRMAFQDMKQTYDKSAIAEKLGVYSKASGGKVPHAQAIGAIISTLDISEDERERLPYCNNGHDGVDYQYTESVVEKVRAWIEAHGRPSPITVNGKNYAVVYKKE